MKSVIVFGGSGYIGQALVNYCLTKGYKVCNLDKTPLVFKHKNYEFFHFDLSDACKLPRLDFTNSSIVYLAGMADLNRALEAPLETIELNITSFSKILEHISDSECCSFNYVSSIYAESGIGGIYGTSKLCAELILEEFGKMSTSFYYNIVRLGSVYGGESSESNGLHRIVKNALEKKSIWFSGPLDTARDYIHIEDVCLALMGLAGSRGKNSKFLIKGNSSVRMTDLCAMLEEYLGLEKADRIADHDYDGHYTQMPFRQPRPVSMIQLPESIDFQHGLKQLCERLSKSESTHETLEI